MLMTYITLHHRGRRETDKATHAFSLRRHSDRKLLFKVVFTLSGGVGICRNKILHQNDHTRLDLFLHAGSQKSADSFLNTESTMGSRSATDPYNFKIASDNQDLIYGQTFFVFNLFDFNQDT